MLTRIDELHADSGGILGAPRMHKDLTIEVETTNKNRVAKLMAITGLHGWPKKKRGQKKPPLLTTLSVNNLLEWGLLALEPFTKWITDIPEFKTGKGKLFLCVVLNVFSKFVIGWSMHHWKDRQIVLRAVEMAVWQHQRSGPVILHSDRGSQFRSGYYPVLLSINKLMSSISAVGHCGNNAACEGFLGVLKRERTNRMRYPTLDSAKADLLDYIKRLHNPRMRRRVARRDMEFLTVFKPPLESG